MKKIRIYLLAAFLASALMGLALRAIKPEKSIDESLFLSEVAPDVVFEAKKGNHYPSAVGVVAFNTYDVTPDIKGYAGPIKVLLALAPDGRINGIKILEHKETPNYARGMETAEFLKQFLNKGVNEAFDVDKDIDAISRATVSVKALADTVRESSIKTASEVMGIRVEGEKSRYNFNPKWVAYGLLFIAALAFYFISRAKGPYDRSRDAIMAGSIAVTGIWFSSPFSILHVFNILLLRYSTDILWLTIVGSAALSIAFAGRFYCGWLCPFGALSEFFGRLPLKKWEITVETDDRWRNLKYYLLGVVAGVVLITGKPEFGNFETYVTLFSRHGNAITWTLVVVGLAANLKVKRLWCRYLCPVAALTGALSRIDPGYVSRKDCPVANKPMPLTPECIRCNRCYRRRGNPL